MNIWAHFLSLSNVVSRNVWRTVTQKTFRTIIHHTHNLRLSTIRCGGSGWLAVRAHIHTDRLRAHSRVGIGNRSTLLTARPQCQGWTSYLDFAHHPEAEAADWLKSLSIGDDNDDDDDGIAPLPLQIIEPTALIICSTSNHTSMADFHSITIINVNKKNTIWRFRFGHGKPLFWGWSYYDRIRFVGVWNTLNYVHENGWYGKWPLYSCWKYQSKMISFELRLQQ